MYVFVYIISTLKFYLDYQFKGMECMYVLLKQQITNLTGNNVMYAL